MGVRGIAASGVFAVGFLSVAVALQCYHCGMYNDGVGSITPCLNETHMKLMECPHRENNFCIKYINEGSTVRDCVPKCIEKEDWGSKTFCCTENGCNSAPSWSSSMSKLVFCTFLVAILAVILH